MNLKNTILSLVVILGLLMTLDNAGVAQSGIPTSSRAYYQKAIKALQENHPTLAIQEFQKVLHLDPNNVAAAANLGLSYYATGNFKGAAQEFRQVLKLHPSLWKAQAILGICDLRLNRFHEAQKHLEGSFAHLQDKKLRTQVGIDMLEMDYRSGNILKATDMIDALFKINPTSIQVLYAAYRTYSQLAGRALGQLALVAPDSGRLHQAIAEHLFNEGNLEAAIRQYRIAIARNPNLSGIHYELGKALFQESKSAASIAQAEREFKAALSVDPYDAKSLCGLGKIYLKEGNLSAAYKAYSQALSAVPDDVQAKIGIGSVFCAQGKLHQSALYLRAAAHQNPMDPAVHHQLAILDKRLGFDAASTKEMHTFEKLLTAHNRIRKVLEQGNVPPAK